MSDPLFEQILAQHENEYKDAEDFGGKWMPPDTAKDDPGYIVSIVRVKTGTFTKKDRGEVRAILTGRIEDPANENLNGKEFTLGFFTTEPTKIGFSKGAATALNGGVTPATKPEAFKILETSLGKVVRVKVKSTTKEDGTMYTNAYIQELIATEVVAPAEASPQT